jgi:hypothetical protein
MLMVLTYGKGRIFHTTLGHDVAALSDVGFMTTFQRGTEWAATGNVTQKVPAGFPTADTVSFRVDIAEMDPTFAKGQAAVSLDHALPTQPHFHPGFRIPGHLRRSIPRRAALLPLECWRTTQPHIPIPSRPRARIYRLRSMPSTLSGRRSPATYR